MAAISANLFAASAPPVKSPVSKSSEPTPNSGFAGVLSETVNRRSRTPADSPTAAAANDAGTVEEVEKADDTRDETTVVPPGIGQAPAQVIAIEPALPQALTTAAASDVVTAVPAPTLPDSITAQLPTSESQAVRNEQPRFQLPVGPPTPGITVSAPAVPAAQTTTGDQPVGTRDQLPPRMPVVAPTPVAGAVANTPTETVAAAARPPAVTAQVPVVADRAQQLPALPPQFGYELVNPNVPGTPQVNPVPPVGSGASQAQVENFPTAVPKPTDLSEPAFASLAPATDAYPAGLPSISTSDRELAADGTVTTPAAMTPGPLPPSEPVSTPPARPAPAAEPAVAPQLSDAFVTHARVIDRAGSHEFQLRLDPPELGEVKVRVLAMGDRVEARLVVSDDAVKRLIESQLPELRQRLEAAGVSVPKFDVTTGGDGRGHTGGGWERPQTAHPTPLRTATPTRPDPRQTTSGGLLDVTA